MKKKVLGALLSVAMVAALLTGCGGSGQAETTAPAADAGAAEAEAPAADAGAAEAEAPAAEATGSGSVYWLNFKPESDEVLQDIAATYKEQTGVEVKVVTAASGTYSQTLISEMDKSAPPDTVCHR